MSQESKFFERPKVRFSQMSDDEEGKQSSKRSDQKRSASGVKIRSVVSVKKPIRIVCLQETNNDNVDKNLHCANETVREERSVRSKDGSTPTKEFGHNSVNDVVTANINNKKSLGDVANAQNIKANSKSLDEVKLDTASCDNIVNAVPSLVELKTADGKSCNKGPLNANKEKFSTCMKSKSRKGKENQLGINRKVLSHTCSSKRLSNRSETGKISENCQSKPHSVENKIVKSGPARIVKPCSSADSVKGTNNKTPSTTRNAKTHLNTKPVVTNVMPCLKYKKYGAKAKTSPVKKILLRDVVGKANVRVEPGVLHCKDENVKPCKSDERCVLPDVSSAEKFARPEYNSILWTINKLNDIKKEKIVTDIEHLPSAYKNIVNGKISTALDFPLDEAVYKHLVDLSIDEKQLPSRVTRSKDPEPRQRDIVPQLSDFFTPESTEEYCTPIYVKACRPEIVGNWNAFRISDKILEWKDTMNQE